MIIKGVVYNDWLLSFYNRFIFSKVIILDISNSSRFFDWHHQLRIPKDQAKEFKKGDKVIIEIKKDGGLDNGK